MEWIVNVEPIMMCVEPAYTPQIEELISAGGQVLDPQTSNLKPQIYPTPHPTYPTPHTPHPTP